MIVAIVVAIKLQYNSINCLYDFLGFLSYTLSMPCNSAPATV